MNATRLAGGEASGAPTFPRASNERCNCCVVGAGATGGHIAVKLALAGLQVSVLARGLLLKAVLEDGLSLEQDGHILRTPVRASDSAHELGTQDIVFIATKSTALRTMAAGLAPLIGARTQVVFLQNGMPWWYPVGLPSTHRAPPELPVFELAPGFLALMRSDQIVGGVVYTANEVLEPGCIRNNSPRKNAIEVGAISGAESVGVEWVRRVLIAAGIQSPPVADIRASMWAKLAGNASASSLCVVTGNPAAIVTDPDIRQTFVRLVDECLQIAAAHGYMVGPLDMQHWTRHRAQHRPSMLQDFDAGRPLELREMVLAPVAFARAAGLRTPTLDAVAAIAARLAEDRGLLA
jgi:2-dehydropantoate 2-reductase